MSPIKSNDEEFRRLAKNTSEGPVVMLNLLKFKPGGAADYASYAKAAGHFVADIGGKVLYLGKAGELLQGNEEWDYVMLVQYPSRQAFIKMINDPEYLKSHEDRLKACERAVLYATDPVKFIDPKG
ncbi:MAG: DUF1330 domain-containing protein [Dehalococcoidia bacterium]|nr:DUF1330 domain-containing protein [Dehalococcoidia bacterium]MDD5493809.1 DUF1330 domain-containing protein [Dehalococcoidia bacterium]